MSDTKTVYKIGFINQGKLYEIFARQVYQGDLFGFIVVEELVFDEKSELIVDTSEEKLKEEFNGVKRSFIPMHSVVRIDEVERHGVAKITEIGQNVTAFPGPYYPSGQPPRRG